MERSANNTISFDDLKDFALKQYDSETKFKIGCRCGFCKKFHTIDCEAESYDSIKLKIYCQNEDSEPLTEECFVLNAEKLEKKDELIQLLADTIKDNLPIKHFLKKGKSVGLYVWKDGRYIEYEEQLKALIESIGREWGIKEKIKIGVVREVIEKIKRNTQFQLKEEPLRIAFKNYAIEWKKLREHMITLDVIPIDETKEDPCFHYIPWNLDVELLNKCLKEYEDGKEVEEIAKEVIPNVVEIFRSWCGDCWIILFEIIGYCLYPDYPFRKAFMLVGSGSNGKSTYLKLLRTILGDENVVARSLQDLAEYKFAVCELYHKLANIYPDIPKNPIKDTGRFKALTGDDVITADRKFKEGIEFRNYAKMIFSANELPEVFDQSDAYWERWIVIEFPNKFPDDPEFFYRNFTPETIEKIIVLSIIAFLDVYLKYGFTIKAEAKQLEDEWLRKVSSVYAYVKARLEEGRIKLDKNAETPTTELYEDYRLWCEEEDIRPEEKAVFTKELERYFGIKKEQVRRLSGRIYVYAGIKLEHEKQR